jgi:hypothetical protein
LKDKSPNVSWPWEVPAAMMRGAANERIFFAVLMSGFLSSRQPITSEKFRFPPFLSKERYPDEVIFLEFAEWWQDPGIQGLVATLKRAA